MIDSLNRLLAPLKTRIANMVARSVVQLVDDSTRMQMLQIGALAGETREGVERFQNYGFTSVPLEGAEALVLFVGGRRDHGMAVAVDDRRHRMKGLEKGEVAIYSKFGSSIVLRKNGDIELTAATKFVFNEGARGVAAEGDTVTITGTAGPYPVIATGIIAPLPAQKVKVP